MKFIGKQKSITLHREKQKDITFVKNYKMKMVFYLNENRQKNLYCRVSDGKERFTISLGRTVDTNIWDEQSGMPKASADFDLSDDLQEYRKYLEEKYHELKLDGKIPVLPLLKNEALKLLEDDSEDNASEWREIRVKLHDLKHIHPAENYIKAFLKFSGAKRKDIQYKPLSGHMLILYEDTTYMISHSGDFKEQYKHYFESSSYDEIYTATPAQLWDFFLTEINPMEADELTTEIYGEWRVYWQEMKERIRGGEQRYERMKTESFRDLQVFFQTLQVNPVYAVKNASAINDIELLPLIAMAVYNSYEDKNEFYDECITFLTDYGEDYLTHGDTFETVCIDETDDDSDEWYYIYNPMFEFND